MTLYQKIGIPTIILSLISFAIYITSRIESEDKMLIRNPHFAIGRIIDWSPGGKSGGTPLDFEFFIENKRYEGGAKYYGVNQRNDYLQNKTFPVIYLKDDPSVNRILIVARDFGRFGLVQPDSLKKYNDKLN